MSCNRDHSLTASTNSVTDCERGIVHTISWCLIAAFSLPHCDLGDAWSAGYALVCCRPVQNYIDHLTSSFSVDCLLPRTILSVMSIEHVEKIFTSMVFPPDACLANVVYFVRTEKQLNEEVCTVMWNFTVLLKSYDVLTY